MYIYITFDYEMFLGPNIGSVDKCLIEPTNRIMEIGDKYDVRFTFFVDVLYLIKMHEYIVISNKIRNDYLRVTQQIKCLAGKGHSIQLHLHPQWFYSHYDTNLNKWNMDFKHYMLDSCPLTDVETMINNGIRFLFDLTGRPVSAFRAGGYSFPKNQAYTHLLQQNGIINDSSVFMLKKEYSQFQNYDYSSIKSFFSYQFDDNITQPSAGGLMTEYPISAIRLSAPTYLYYRLLKGRNYRKKSKVYGDGIGVGAKLSFVSRMNNRLKQLVYPTIIPASLDSMKSLFLDKVKKRAFTNRGNCFVIIGHPKNTSELGLECLERIAKCDANMIGVIA